MSKCKLFRLLFITILIFSRSTYAQQCDEVLKPIYQTMHVSNDSEYLEKLETIYSASSQSDLNSKSSSAGNLIVPGYGTAAFNSNKNKVQSYRSRLNLRQNHLLTMNEYLDVNTVYTSSQTDLHKLDKWIECVAITNHQPRLSVSHDSDTDVMVTWQMPPNDYLLPGELETIRGINTSSNLILISSDVPRDNKISYRGSYTLTYKRVGKDSLGDAFVSVDLERGRILPAHIKSRPNEMIIVEKEETLNLPARININAGTFDLYNNGAVLANLTFAQQNLQYYQLTLSFNTYLRSDLDVITDYYYVPEVGGFNTFQKRSVNLLPNSELGITFYFVNQARIMAGNFVINYKRKYLQPRPR